MKYRNDHFYLFGHRGTIKAECADTLGKLDSSNTYLKRTVSELRSDKDALTAKMEHERRVHYQENKIHNQNTRQQEQLEDQLLETIDQFKAKQLEDLDTIQNLENQLFASDMIQE